MANRVVSPFDVLLNTAGAALAILTVNYLLHHNVRVRSALLAVAGTTFLGILAWLFFTFVAVTDQQRISGWDPGFAILAGHEVGGAQVYQGEVRDAEICTLLRKVQLCIRPHTSEEDRQRFTTAAEESDYFNLSATVVSHSDRQSGPTRTITFSNGPAVRNATLSQEGRSLIFRVRTPLAGSNGSAIVFTLPDAIVKGESTNVGATFERTKVTMYANMSASNRQVTFTFDITNSWVTTLAPIRLAPQHLDRARLSAMLVTCFPFGWAIGMLSRSKNPRIVAVMPGAVALLLYGTLPSIYPMFPSLAHLIFVVATVALGACLGIVDRIRTSNERETL
jgi:hypothetical protein